MKDSEKVKTQNTIVKNSKTNTTDKEDVSAENKKGKKNPLIEWLRFKNNKTRTFVFIFIIFVLISTTLAIGYFSIFKWLPQLWNWGFTPLTWRSILSILGAIYLVIFPFVPYSILSATISGIIELYNEDSRKNFNLAISEFENKQAEYEKALTKSDTEDLIPLINYSRLELKQYHEIGLHQTQKSYNFSIIAMWIGFFIIAFGIMSYILPSQYINKDLINGNFQILTISSGIIVELISALFLWIYKSSINRLTYFYNRQVFIHNALFAFKISNTMKDPDLSKKMIVEKILEFGISSNSAALLNLKNKEF